MIDGTHIEAKDEGERNDLETLLVAAIGSVLDPASAVYCSAPITTGIRFVRWLESMPDRSKLNDPTAKADFEAQVLVPNCQEAKRFAGKLRTKLNSSVIDPSRLPAIDSWGQDKWLPFWARVIKAYAHTVAFIDGWEYSGGCVYEFYVATDSGIATIDERGNVLTLGAGVGLIRMALRTLEESHAPTESHARTLERLQKLGYSESQG